MPALLECQTYRHYGHSKSDPATYRPKEEVERWLAHDPLKIARERLLSLGVSEEEIAEVEQGALAAPFPDPLDLPEFAR